MRDVFLYDAVRTPRGKARAGGGLAELTPQELVRQTARALEARCDVQDPDALLLGCVGQFGAQGGNIALVSKFYAQLPDEMSAMTLNNLCASGLYAIGMAAASVQSGLWDRAYAGGVEMMSRAPFMGDDAAYYTDASFPPRTRYVPVVLTADRLAAAEKIDRAALDAVALSSQQKAAQAEQTPAFQKSRIAVTASDRATALDRDECVRPQTTAESLAAMEPAFGPLAADYAEALGDHQFPPVHTISHAPPICDGAGLALVGARRDGIKPRARIVAFADTGGDPFQGLTAGFAAMEKVLARAGLSLGDMGRIEFMESFAVTIAKFLRDYPADPQRVNVSGGHLAKGHPLGGSGAILVSTLLDCLDEADEELGMVVITGANGVGAAMIVERL